MNNIVLLEEEYNEYIRQNNEKSSLESSLRDLSGHNDEESVRRMNDISKRLGNINNNLSLYDQKIIPNVQNYLNLRNRYNDLSKDIKAVEELSKEGKKSNSQAEFITLTSAEGRSKQIDKKLASDYIKLVEEKQKTKNELNKSFELIKKYTSMKTDSIKEEVKEEKDIEYILPKIDTYDDLPIEDKIKETKDRIERIFASSKLPNMGKKIIVNYNNEKHEIPEKYRGLFNATYLELKKLENSLDKKIDNDKMPPITVNDKESQKDKVPISSFDLNHDKEMYEKFGVPFDPEKQKRINELASKLFDSQNEDVVELRFKEGVKQKVNTTKGYVSSASKKVVSYLKEKTEKVKIKVDNVKEKKEEVSYQIVNRTVNFKENVCQKVNEKKSKFASIKKSALESIRRPFDSLREKRENYVTKKELRDMVDLLKEQNKLLTYQNKVLTRKLVNNSGFVSTATFIITTSVLITIAIFLVVGFIVFR